MSHGDGVSFHCDRTSITSMTRLSSLATAIFVALPIASVSQQLVTLESLLSDGVFAVTIDGRRTPSPTDGRPAVYLEIVNGERSGSSWITYSLDRRTSDDLLIVSPKGTVSVPPVRLRLYLRPSGMHRIRRTRNYLGEYRLTPGRTYYAMVVEEHYYLPPRDEGLPPSRETNYVLQISDRRFVGGKPVGEMTPGTRGITY